VIFAGKLLTHLCMGVAILFTGGNHLHDCFII